MPVASYPININIGTLATPPTAKLLALSPILLRTLIPLTFLPTTHTLRPHIVLAGDIKIDHHFRPKN